MLLFFERNACFFLILIFLVVACEKKNGQNPIDNRLSGKWNVVSEIESEKVGNIEKITDKDIYAAGEKTYEFTNNNKLIIEEGYGRHSITLPVWMEGGKLFIGQGGNNKNYYTPTFTESHVLLVKEELENEEGQIITTTEELKLER